VFICKSVAFNAPASKTPTPQYTPSIRIHVGVKLAHAIGEIRKSVAFSAPASKTPTPQYTPSIKIHVGVKLAHAILVST